MVLIVLEMMIAKVKLYNWSYLYSDYIGTILIGGYGFRSVLDFGYKSFTSLFEPVI